MTVVAPLIGVLALAAVSAAGARIGLTTLFCVVIPYAAILVFLIGVVWRVLSWARRPTPFNITTTCGQQHSLRWIQSSPLENPHTRLGVIGRVLLEVLLFRSLFRNVKHEFVSRENAAPRLAYKASPWLWLGALAFHYSFLVVFVRHYRFFSEPTPRSLQIVEMLDGFFQIGSPTIFVSGFVLLAAATFLLLRRLLLPQLRYISLPVDYFPLFLVIGIALTGILMRYTAFRTDTAAVKNLCIGLMQFKPPAATEPIGAIFFVHLTLVSCLFAYLPYSKLSHMMGVWLSPTRNLIGASRMRRHINPWNYPVAVHTYEEYENEWRDKMKAAGIPVDKE